MYIVTARPKKGVERECTDVCFFKGEEELRRFAARLTMTKLETMSQIVMTIQTNGYAVWRRVGVKE